MTNTFAEQELIKSEINYIPVNDSSYPHRLRSISSRPKGLYYIGHLPAENLPCVAIIGARNCSGYGRQLAREFAREIAEAGIQVISGMARGIDGIAGQSAIDVGGKSYAVLGSGVDICYPKENERLYRELIAHGGIISEYDPGTPARSTNFPARNRIISGLSDAVIVIEARERSGTLITVTMALDQGRDIYALPGRVTDSLSRGCNQLIRDGAFPLSTPYEFIQEFMGRFAGSSKGVNASHTHTDTDSCDNRTEAYDNMTIFMTKKERLILDVLDYTPKSAGEIFYDIGDRSDMSISDLLCTLTDMTVRHMIDCIDGSNYCIHT